MTDSMRQAMGETSRRRAKQEAYNRENNITPQSIIKSVDMQLAKIVEADYIPVLGDDTIGQISSEEDLQMAVAQLEEQMRAAAKGFEFERAAALRDRIRGLKQHDLFAIETTKVSSTPEKSESSEAAKRSEERRVGKECRSRRSREHDK